MGNNESRPATYGFRVIKVAPNSPAKNAGLTEFLDYIVDISNSSETNPFTGNYNDFFKIVQASEDQKTTMKVYNMLSRKVRTVTILPSKKWENSDSLLGALVRYEEYASSFERVLRVAKVHANSPASAAGLQADSDYILGSPQYLYTDLSELANFIEMTQEKETIKSLELYIYSSQTNSVRSTLIIPNKNWGGQGHLGCEFALGILNYLPVSEENVFISSLGEIWSNSSNEVDRLDADTPTLPGLPHTSKLSNNASDNMSTQDNSNNEHKPDETPEFMLRPPTSAEIEKNRSPTAEDNGRIVKAQTYDLSQELTNQRMKLLHMSHQHKTGIKSASKPFIKSGRSAANPFMDVKQANGSEEDANSSDVNVSTQNESENTENQNHKIEKHQEVAEVHIKDEETRDPNLNQLNLTLQTNSVDTNIVQNTTDLDEGSKAPVEVSESNIVNRPEEQKIKEEDNIVVEPPEKTEILHAEKPVKMNEKVESLEKKVKTTIEYNFFSKKLNGDYKIKSMNLFNIEDLMHIH